MVSLTHRLGRSAHARSALPRIISPSKPFTASPGPRSPRHVYAAVASTSRPDVAPASPDKPAAQVHEARAISKFGGRVVTIAVDGKEDSEAGLKWAIDNCLCQGDTIKLVSVVTNDRAQPIGVGMTQTTGTITSFELPDYFGYEKTKAHGQRLLEEAEAMMATRYVPMFTAEASLTVEASVRIVDGHQSAAAIAEAVVAAAHEASTDVLIVTSHGAGTRCSYGSVARYCISHFRRAVLVLPPGLDTHPHRASSALAVGISHLGEFQDATTWAVDHLYRGGDQVCVLRSEEAEVVKKESSSQTAMMGGFREQYEKHRLEDLSYTVLRPFSDPSTDPEAWNEHAADEMLRVAADKQARAIVMVNYSNKGLLQEMMFGSLALMVSRHASLPLALVPPGYAVE